MATEEWLISATISASAPANTRTSATIQRRAGDSALSTQQAPFREIFQVEDIYYVGTNPSPDVQLILKVDGVDQPITPLASSVNIANLTRLRLSLTIPVPRGSVITSDMMNIGAVGTDAITVVFKLRTLRKVVAE
jgi:hypothetical protein